jgi:hypothetical protein
MTIDKLLRQNGRINGKYTVYTPVYGECMFRITNGDDGIKTVLRDLLSCLHDDEIF